MDRSKFIASLAGPVFLALGLSMLLNRDLFPAIAQQISASYPLIIVSGALTLVAGLAILRVHNDWAGWHSVVTLLGWLLVLGGALRILMPRQLATIASNVSMDSAYLVVPALILSALGAFLTAKAYF